MAKSSSASGPTTALATETARVAVAGATGLIGRALVAQAAARGPKATCYALTREGRSAAPAPWPTGVTGWPVDFNRLGHAGTPDLPAIDWALCALGTTIAAAGSRAAFRAVDFDAVLAFARAARAAGAQRLAVVSALGADARAGMFYNQVKGEAEAALTAMQWPRLVIARPSLLLGERQALGQPNRPGELLAQALSPALAWLMPSRWRPIHSDAVARAMWRALQTSGPALQVLENEQLQALADQA